MSWNELLSYVGLTARALSFVLTAAFIVRYSRRPWRSTPAGVHLMVLSLSIGAYTALALTNMITAYIDPTVPIGEPDGDWPGRAEVTAALYLFTSWIMFRQNLLLNQDPDRR